MSTTAAVVAVVGLGLSIRAQDKARGEQRKARREQRAVARAQAIRQNQQQIRQSRIARAQAVNRAYISGGEGSTLAGAEGSIGSQMGGNLAFGQGVFNRTQSAAGHMSSAQRHMFRSNIFGTIGGFASQYGDFSSVGNIFKPQTTRTSTPAVPQHERLPDPLNR